jgi:hypothetical protein
LVEDPNDPGTYQIQTLSISETPSGSGSFPNNGGSNSTVLNWNRPGERLYETGLDRGVLYLDGLDGIAWNGLIAVNESSSGGDPKPYYLDGVKYLNHATKEEFEASIEAYTYPEEFAMCDGTNSIAQGLFLTQQMRKPFGLSYRTRVGNDLEGTDHGYKIHLVYNALASPSDKDYQTFGESAEVLTFNWKISATPKKFEDAAFGTKYGAHIVIDSRTTYPWVMAAIEGILYGTISTAPAMPTPSELISIFADNALLKITDNGDGSWTADGPDAAITMLSDTEFQIDWESAIYISEDTYQISSL